MGNNKTGGGDGDGWASRRQPAGLRHHSICHSFLRAAVADGVNVWPRLDRKSTDVVGDVRSGLGWRLSWPLPCCSGPELRRPLRAVVAVVAIGVVSSCSDGFGTRFLPVTVKKIKI